VLEPPKRKLVEGWPLEAIALHLEAVTFGDIDRLLINVPPGFMKSLCDAAPEECGQQAQPDRPEAGREASS
jgi:hypothetical protein